MKKRSLSLALLAAFNFTPALEAAEDSISVTDMVNSISGILGGTYTVSGTGTPSINTDPFGGSYTVGTTSSTPGGSGLSQSINNPSVTNFGLYGSSGLLSSNASNYLYGLQGVDIYDWGTVSGALQNAQNLASQYYNYRILFGGITSGGNALGSNYPYATIPVGQTNAGGVNSTYWTINQSATGGGSGSTASVAGTYFDAGSGAQTNAINSTYLAGASTSYATNAAKANNLLTAIYSNISSLADYTGLKAQYTSGGNAGPLNTSNLGASSETSANYANALTQQLTAPGSVIQSVGNQLVQAFGDTSAGLGQGIDNMNKLLFSTNADATAAGKAIFTSAAQNTDGTQYTTTAGTLNALEAINTLNSLVAGGIVAATSGGNTAAQNAAAGTINPYWTTAIDAIKSGGALDWDNITAITNNIMNKYGSSDTGIAKVIDTLAGLSSLTGWTTGTSASDSYTKNMAIIDNALQGMVSPTAYEAVYKAYYAITTTTDVLGTSNSAGLWQAFGASSQGQAFVDAIKFSQALTALGDAVTAMKDVGGSAGGGVNAVNVNTALLTAGNIFGGVGSDLSGDPLKTALEALLGIFGSGAGNGAAVADSTYTTFDNLISQLDKLAQASVSAGGTGLGTNGGTALTNTTTTVPATPGPGNATTNNKSTQYPVQNTGAPAASNPTITSYATQQAANNTAAQQALNQALGKLLAQAATYAGNVSTLQGLLTPGAARSSLLNKILTQAIDNAAGNAIYNSGAAEAGGKADAINTQAQVYNNIKAAIASHDLLDSYVAALTASTYSTSAQQQAQASALTDLYKAINASTSGALATQGMLGATKADIAAAGGFTITGSSGSAATSEGYSLSVLQTALGLTTSSTVGLSTSDTLAWNQGWNATNIKTALNTLVNDVATLKNSLTTNSDANDIATQTSTVGTAVGNYDTLANSLSSLVIDVGGTTYSGKQVTPEILQQALVYLVANNNTTVSTVFKNFAAASGGVNQMSVTLKSALNGLVGNTTAAAAGSDGASVSATNEIKTLSEALANTPGYANQAQLAGLITQANKVQNLVNAINGMLTSAAGISNWTTGGTGNTLGGELLGANASTWDGYINSATTVFNGVPVKAQGMTTALNTLESQVQSALNAINLGSQIGFLGVASDGTVTLDTKQMNTYLGQSVSTANLPLAAAAVSSINNALNSLATGGNGGKSLIDNGIAGLQLAPTPAQPGATPSSSTPLTLSGLATDAATLNSAVQKLWGLTDGAKSATNFFGSANTSNLSNTSNVNVNGVATQSGIGSISVGGNFAANSNAATYLNGINAIATINDYIGSLTTSSGGQTPTYTVNDNYTNVLGTGGAASAISTNYTALNSPTGGFATGMSLQTLVGALETLNPKSSDTEVTAAISSQFTSGAGNAAAVTAAWTAWKAIAYKGDSTTGGALSLMNQAFQAATTYAQDNNTTAGTGTDTAMNNFSVTNPSNAKALAALLSAANSAASALSTATSSLATGGGTPLSATYGTATGLKLTNDTAAVFNQAQAVANALSTIWDAANEKAANGNMTANVIIPLIQALNTYNHNNALLGKLVGGQDPSATIQTIEKNLLTYAQGINQAMSLTGVTSNAAKNMAAIKDGLAKLQNLIDRYQYLEGLSSQVTTAMLNNPLALVAGQQAVVSGTTFQNAASNLATNILSTTGKNNLFTYDGTDYGAAGTMAQSLSAMENTINANKATINAWNAYVDGTSGNTTTYLTNMAKSVTNLAGYVANASLSNTTLQSMANTTTQADTDLKAIADNASYLGLFQGANSTTAPTTGLTWGGTTSATNAAVYGTLNAIDQLNTWFGGDSADAKGLISTAGGGNFANFQAATGKLSDLNTQIGNLLSPLTATSPDGFVPKNITLGSQDAVGFLSGVLGKLQSDTTVNNLLTGATITSTTTTTFTPAVLQTLQQALSPILGAENADYLTSANAVGGSTAPLTKFLAAAQAILNDITNNSTTGGIASKIAASGTDLNLGTVQGQLQAAQDINALYNTVTKGLIANANSNSTIVGDSATGFNADTWAAIQKAIGAANELKPTIDPTQSFITYITNNASDTSAMPTSLQEATSVLGVVAVELKAMGVSPSDTTPDVGDYISAATPAQIAQVVSKIVANLGTPNSLITSSMDAQAMTSIFGNVLDNAKSYNTANTNLGTTGATSGASATTQAINNANSVQQLMKVLQGVSNGTYTKDQLTEALKLLGNMGNIASVVTTLQTGTSAAAQEARNIQNAANNSVQATTLLNELATVSTAVVLTGNETAQQYMSKKAQAYLTSQNNAQNGTITMQANIMANGPANLATLLSSLQALSKDNFASGTVATGIATSDVTGANNVSYSGKNLASSLSSLNSSISNAYSYLFNNLSINANQAQSMLQNLVNQIGSLQREVVNVLVALNTAVYDANQQNAGSDLMAKGGKYGFLQKGFGQMTPLSAAERQALASQYKTLLAKLNNAKAYAQASLAKYSSNLGVRTALKPPTRRMQTNTQNGNMYGINMQFGYKQFFGKKKRWGLRYYASFSYQHGTFNISDVSDVDNFVYGAGVDALYNFYESKDGNMTSGIFAGLMLAGTTWNAKNASYYKAQMEYIKSQGGTASMNTSYFQLPINLGFRTNVNRHNGFEIGLRIPLVVNYYYRSNLDGVRNDVAFKRNISVFFNYVYNF
ncbi:hypothetical protein NHP20013_01790 [Helicobacter bizzozeronii]|nr:hypothetical protein NHP20013_01790 [Helicobacter bizzozeronii]